MATFILEAGIVTSSCFASPRCGCGSACPRLGPSCSRLRLHVFASSGASLAYQLDFVTPGSWPLSASSRKQIRHSAKCGYTPRPAAELAAVALAHLSTSAPGSPSTIIDIFATVSLVRSFCERHAHQLEQALALFVVRGRRHDVDLHAADACRPCRSRSPGRSAARARQGCSCRGRRRPSSARRGSRGCGAVRRSAAGRGTRTCARHAASPSTPIGILADLEVRDRLLRARDDRLLAGDRRDVGRRPIERVARCRAPRRGRC